MSTPYIGEIRMFGGNFAINGWAFCDGSIQSIAQNSVLFNLIGTTYGGDGQSTFALPDLQGRVPVHIGAGINIGEKSGTETVTLTSQQIPIHTHIPLASSVGGSDNPSGNFWGTSTLGKPYAAAPGALAMNTASVQAQGGNQPHNNLIPYTCITYIISLFGVYPSQN